MPISMIHAGNHLKARSKADSGPYIEKGLVLVWWRYGPSAFALILYFHRFWTKCAIEPPPPWRGEDVAMYDG
jgi:hypothetical protein